MSFALLSRPWFLDHNRLVLCSVTRSAVATLPTRNLLAPAEYARWAALPADSPRRWSLLMGRIAAKEAVRQWASICHGMQLEPVQVEIRAAHSGRPLVHALPGLSGHAYPNISISHTADRAVAAATEPLVYPGIDVELFATQRLGPHFPDLFSAAEQAMATRGKCLDFTKLLGLWSIKEAAAKAVGAGLCGAPQDWVVTDYQETVDTAQRGISSQQLVGEHSPNDHLARLLEDAQQGKASVHYQDRQLAVRFWRTPQLVFACSLADRLLPGS